MDETGGQRGLRFGRYEVLRSLGRGASGEVFEAQHVDLGRRVALKVLRTSFGTDGTAMQQALREGRAATAMSHPHVVDVIDVGEENGTPYLVMELLRGEDLASRLEREAPLAPQAIADLLLEVVSGVCAMHRAGVIHRDLKPSNVFLAQRHSGIQAVVVDLGVSRNIVGDKASSPNAPIGTVLYMAPEKLRGARETTAACDQYSLGVIAYECATGGTPFWSEDLYELLHTIMTAPLVPPSEMNPALGPGLDAVVLRALARSPADRFESVASFGHALAEFASAEAKAKWEAEFGPPAEPRDLESRVVRPVVKSGRGEQSTPRRWGRAAALVSVAFVAVVSALAAGRQERREAPAARLPAPMTASVSSASPGLAPAPSDAPARKDDGPVLSPKREVREATRRSPVRVVNASPAPSVREGTNGAFILDVP